MNNNNKDEDMNDVYTIYRNISGCLYENSPYLGVTLSSQNKFHGVLSEVVRQTARSQIILNQHILRHPSVTPMHIFERFDCLLTPKLTYGCVVLGVGKYNKIEQFHLAFLGQTLQVKCSTDIAMLYAEAGRYPLYVAINYQIIKYWLKILNSPDTS